MAVPERSCPTLLISALAPFEPRTMIDCAHRGPWWNARRCWIDGAATGCSHVLLAQDDAVPVGGFARLARAAVEARPESIISFFYHNDKAAGEAGRAPWVEFPISNWGVALCMPAKMAQDMVAWNDEYIQPTVSQDDLRVLHYAANHGMPVCATNPSLVEHSPNMASTVSPRPSNREFMASSLYRGEAMNWGGEAYKMPGDTRAFLISRQHHRSEKC